MRIKDRINQYLDKQNISVNKFEITIGASKSYWRNTKSISAEILSEILRIYSDLNAYWVLNGEGEMLKEDNNKIEISADEYERVKEKAEIYSEAFVEERRRMKVKEYVIDELLKILKENNIPVKITEIEKGASRLYGESQEGSARNVG